MQSQQGCDGSRQKCTEAGSAGTSTPWHGKYYEHQNRSTKSPETSFIPDHSQEPGGKGRSLITAHGWQELGGAEVSSATQIWACGDAGDPARVKDEGERKDRL